MSASNKYRLQAGTICTIVRSAEPGEDLYCRVVSESEQWLCVERMDNPEEYLGISVFEIDSIARVRFGNVSPDRLFGKRKTHPEFPVPHSGFDFEYFEKVQSKFGSITLFCEFDDPDICFVGRVTEVQDGVVFLDEYPSFESDEITKLALPLESITRVEAGGDYEAKVIENYKTLYQKK